MSVTITISPPQSLDDAGQLSRVKGRVMEKKKQLKTSLKQCKLLLKP